MQVNSVGNMTVQSSSGDQGSITALERQRDQVQQKIRALASDKTMDAKQKQEELALYQAQLQIIEAQIEQLLAKQAQAKAQAASAHPARSQSSEESGQTEATDSKRSILHVVA